MRGGVRRGMVAVYVREAALHLGVPLPLRPEKPRSESTIGHDDIDAV